LGRLYTRTQDENIVRILKKLAAADPEDGFPFIAEWLDKDKVIDLRS
jgi:hypothetical protein